MKKIVSILLAFVAAFTLVACGNSDKALLQEALDTATSFSGNPETEGITRDQNFPTKLRDYEGVELTWVSSHPDILSSEGKVTRPAPGADDVMVTMTVTATKGKNKLSDTAKFLVLAEEVAEEVTLSDLYDEKEDISANGDGTKFKYKYLNELVEINNLTVAGIYANKNGFYLTDGVRLLFVYNPTLAKEVKLNEVYNIKGTFGHNYGSAQLSSDAELVLVENGTPKKPALVKAKVGPDFVSTKTYGSDFLFEPVVYELTGKVMIDTSDASRDYQTFLVAPDYEGYKVVKTVEGDKAVAFETDTVNVYYQGLVEPIKKHNGRVITATYFPVGLRSDRGQLNYGVILDEESIKVHEITPEEEFINAQYFVKADYDGKLFKEEDGQIDFFTEKVINGDNKATYSWVSKNPTIIDNEGNILEDALTGAINEVSFDVTVSYLEFDPVVVTVKFELLKDLVISTVDEANKMAVGSFVKLVVNLSLYQPKNFLLTDATGSIALRDNPDLIAKLDLTKTYTVIGEIAIFGGNPQISIVAIDEVTTKVTNIDLFEILEDSVLTENHAVLSKITGKVTEVTQDTYKNTIVKVAIGEKVFFIKLDERIEKSLNKDLVAAFKGLKVDDNVTIEGIVIIVGKDNDSGELYSNIHFSSSGKVIKK